MKKNIAVAFASIAFALAGAVAHAAPADANQASNGSEEARSLTRAEVAADLAVWKRAGLDQFSRGDSGPDVNSPEYRAAYANYLRMRRGAEYQAELARNTGHGE
jgi:hypothetical protein